MSSVALPFPFNRRRMGDMTSSQRYHIMEKVLMGLGREEETPTGGHPTVGNDASDFIKNLGPKQFLEALLAQQKRTDGKLDDLGEKMVKVRIEIAVLKSKASQWGGVAGLVGGALASLVVALIVSFMTKR